jgi:hypothetical protein
MVLLEERVHMQNQQLLLKQQATQLAQVEQAEVLMVEQVEEVVDYFY